MNHGKSVAGSVIQATGTVEFEDGLRTGVLPRSCWLHLAWDQLQTLLGIQVVPSGGVVVIGTLLSDQTPILLSPFPYHVLLEEGVLQTRQSLGLEAEPHQGPTHNWI